MQVVSTSSLANQNISAALLVHTYTATDDMKLYINVYLDQIIGNGNYSCWLTVQRAGAGSHCRVIPITTAWVENGVTATSFSGGAIVVPDNSVVRVYVQGLATDIATPDITTDVWEDEQYTIFPAGAIDFTYTVTDISTGLPIEGVEVWFSTDAAGTNIVWKGETDAFGVARDVLGQIAWLDAGLYAVWRQRAGYVFTNPDWETAS